MNVYVDGPWADKQDKLLRYVEDEHSAYVQGPFNIEGLEILRTGSDKTSFITHSGTGNSTAIYCFGGNALGVGAESGDIYIGACWSWPSYTSLPTPGIYSHEGQDIHVIAHEIALTAQDTDTNTEFEVAVYPNRVYFNDLSIYSERHGNSSVFIDGPLAGIKFGKDLYDKNGGKLSGFDRIKEDGNSVYINGPLNVTKICANSLYVDGPTVITGDIFAIDVLSSWENRQGINMRVDRSHTVYPDSGLGIKEFADDSADGGIRIYPCLCSYHTGPHICGWHGDEGRDDNMHIVSGRGGGIALTIQDSNGSPRTARLTYENITKLIALLESTD